MHHLDRRAFLLGVGATAAGAAALAACTTDTPPGPGNAGAPGTTAAGLAGTTPDTALAAPGTSGLIDEAVWQGRVDEFLAFAAAEKNLTSPTGIAVQLIQAHRDPTYTWPVADVTVDSLQRVWEQIDAWEDTRDFNFMYLHWLLGLADGSSPSTTLDPALIAAIEQRMKDNRYRYNDPLPADRLDNQWFWSENHIVIGHVIEYLAGRRFPDDRFTITGLTGTEHAERARVGILEWVDERAKLGFSEWHSNVYMLKNITPLLLLIELGDDAELVAAAGRALDLCLVDVAAHTHRGTYSATRGRTYKKDKMSARDEATFGTAKLMFDDTEIPFLRATDTGVTYFCAAKRYRPPQALINIATDPDPVVVRERHGIFVDGAAPVTEDVEAPLGYDFDDAANLPFWWSQGAVGMWQITRVSLAEAEKFRLLETELLAQVNLLVELNGRDPERVRTWLQKNHDIVNFGHLREANTYAWRGNEVMLASVVDHRFGQMRDQIHAWQATIDADALVFTTHPTTGPVKSDDWSDDEGPGYWTGEASVPRTAQHERTAIHIYQPAYDEQTDTLLWSVFGYQPFTHAYVPQDHFDEVRQEGNWTLVSKGGGYIALWSWRTPTFRELEAEIASRELTKPFDLVAEGGPDNVWIVEVGEQSEGGASGPGTYGSFDDFVTAVRAQEPVVERDTEGFTVAWTSPSAEAVTFGSTAPFTVAGSDVPLGEYPRHESKWGSIDRLATTYEFRAAGSALTLDFAAGSRRFA